MGGTVRERIQEQGPIPTERFLQESSVKGSKHKQGECIKDLTSLETIKEIELLIFGKVE